MITRKPFTPNSNIPDRQVALAQIYQQVLERQPSAWEHRQLGTAEQDFLTGKIGVRRFLKQFACSPVYLRAFYEQVSNLKFIELGCKHFLGRAPRDQAEIKELCEVLMNKGVVGLVNLLLDSEEYRKAFGCFEVPHARLAQRYYSSPQAYLESELVNHEHPGQRGWGVPAIYRQPALSEPGPTLDNLGNPDLDHLEAEFLNLLQILGSAREHLGTSMSEPRSSVKRVIGSLSPTQKEALRQAIHH